MIGVSPLVRRLLADYLHNRRHSVVVDGAISSSFEVKSGVPQGSVLGPLLFVIFINDLFGAVSHGSDLNAFADDTLLFRGITCQQDTFFLSADLGGVERWAKQWKLCFNVSKCAYMRIALSRRARTMYPCPVYSLGGEVIPHVSFTRYLGVTIQNNFRFARHIRTTISSCNKLIGLLRRNISDANVPAKRTAFITLVRSRLEYAASIYDPSQTTYIDALEAVQNRGARFITRKYNRFSSVTDLKAELKLPPLSIRRAEARRRLLRKFLSDPECIPGAAIVHRQNSFYFIPVVELQLLRSTVLYRSVEERFSLQDDDGRLRNPP